MAPIAGVDIDLGQHELVEEVLGVDARACVAQYVVSVYTTTPLRDRVDAILRALEQVEGVGRLSSPIEDMEDCVSLRHTGEPQGRTTRAISAPQILNAFSRVCPKVRGFSS